MNGSPAPYKIDTHITQYLRKHSRFLTKGFLMYPEENCCLPDLYKHFQEDILNLKVFPDDIWLVTYPKCGTTWTQEMLWLIANDLDYEKAKVCLEGRFPFLEFPSVDEEYTSLFGIDKENPLAPVLNMKSPRYIKSHLPVSLLPREMWKVDPKIIYVMREPKDVAASYLNHYRILFGYSGTVDSLLEAFLSDQVAWGSYWGNVASFWRRRHQPNVLINTYEEMKQDLPAVIRRTAKFLGKTVPEGKMENLAKHLSFSSMKNNDSANLSIIEKTLKQTHNVAQNESFMNRGVTGNYKQIMSPEWVSRFDSWAKQEKVKYGITDPDFPY